MPVSPRVGGDAEIDGCGAIGPYGIRRWESVGTPSSWQALSLAGDLEAG